jgi:hydroxymethylpyrimidine pyrophosphatase-like HAD family hydrolase
MSGVFSEKLDRIGETLSCCFLEKPITLAHMMAQCAKRPTYNVGSGGSVIVAEFLGQCRAQLGFSMTSVVTPMTFSLESTDPAAASWFFSASGNNEDIQAAYEHGLRCGPHNLYVLTNSYDGELARLARDYGGACYVSPVADAKDGFLATHSVISSTLSILMASDRLAGRIDIEERQAQLRNCVSRHLSYDARLRLVDWFGASLDCETIVLLHDPQLAAAATLIETSAWEAGLCGVQRTDFRNFAHGRHVWLDKHPQRTLVLALTSDRTLSAWKTIEDVLLPGVNHKAVDFGRAGRAARFEALAFGLAFIEALGLVKGIDPGKPGVANFGRLLFDSDVLHDITAADEVSVRRKRQAGIRADTEITLDRLHASREEFVSNIQTSIFGGIVLDYDGTVVSTEKRYDPPATEIITEILRLIDAGILIAFATGRGGSIGEMLRDIIPESYHQRILIGYYNGAWIVPLANDVSALPPPKNVAIGEARRRLVKLAGLFRDGWEPKDAPVQLAIPRDKFVEEDKGLLWLEEALSDLPLQILQSGHAIDVFPANASKRDVVSSIRRGLEISGTEILCIGDRGERLGNDHELLEGPYGVSVGKVCDRPKSCWNLAPDHLQGPAALETLLKALKVVDTGQVKLHVPVLFSLG